MEKNKITLSDEKKIKVKACKKNSYFGICHVTFSAQYPCINITCFSINDWLKKTLYTTIRYAAIVRPKSLFGQHRGATRVHRYSAKPSQQETILTHNEPAVLSKSFRSLPWGLEKGGQSYTVAMQVNNATQNNGNV